MRNSRSRRAGTFFFSTFGVFLVVGARFFFSGCFWLDKEQTRKSALKSHCALPGCRLAVAIRFRCIMYVAAARKKCSVTCLCKTLFHSSEKSRKSFPHFRFSFVKRQGYKDIRNMGHTHTHAGSDFMQLQFDFPLNMRQAPDHFPFVFVLSFSLPLSFFISFVVRDGGAATLNNLIFQILWNSCNPARRAES